VPTPRRTSGVCKPGSVTAADWKARVLDAVDDSSAELVTFLAELVRMPSVGGTDAENEAQQHLAGAFDRVGLEVDHWRLPLPELLAEPDFPGVEVDRDEAWGLVGRLPGNGGGRSLMWNGHIDVVPPGDAATWTDRDPYSGRLDGALIRGRGACDMKAGLTAAFFAVRALARSGVPLGGDVLLASVQGEEDGGLGSYALIRRGWRADACVIPEPTGLDIVPATAGALTFRLRVPGKATHAARRTSGVSALEKFWPVWRALSALEHRRNATVDPLVARWDVAYPISVGVVRGGDWASTVPDVLVAEGRLGVALGEPVAAARADLELAVAQACDADPWLRDHPVQVEWWGGAFAPGRLPPESDLVQRMSAAHAQVSERPAQTWAAPYGSDLRLLTNLAGVPTLHYGPGDLVQAHAPDESVSLDQVFVCTRALALLALDMCGVQGEQAGGVRS
jgi:acetylornithine deacetylase